MQQDVGASAADARGRVDLRFVRSRRTDCRIVIMSSGQSDKSSNGKNDDMTMNGAGNSAKPPPPAESAPPFAPAPAAAAGVSREQRHHRHRSSQPRPKTQSISGGRGQISIPPSSSPTDDDAAYCTEIARRSVARAALHLGTEGMETEALDVLGSVLLGYLEMVRMKNGP